MDNEPTIKDVVGSVQSLVESVQSLTEKVEFIKNNAATKDDIRELKNEMIEHVDGFIALYQKHEVELAALAHRQEKLEEKLNKIIHHLGLKIA